DGILRYEEMTLNFQKEFENQVSLRAPRQVKPGENVTITISAQPKSYVSVLAVDLSVYLLDKTYDLSRTNILNDLLNEKTFSPVLASVYPGIVSGIITLTNAQYSIEDFYDEESRLPLKENNLVQRIESKNADTSIVFYLDSLEANINHCLNIPADKTNEILMPKPAAIVMYDYYNLTRSNTEFYSLN
ncbi:hypothetical protein DOY81_010570, partial [Sarcophaga bullata]